ncbi:MAG: hypothetical protein GWO22_29555, partial [Actinobacteria bacterium]|nr:hypothetical protein [Actinomycetota bacterium]NIW31331.1 hypothetical protein [Actinomycetota bacterium]
MEESFAPFTGEVRLPDGALQLTLGDTARVNVTVVDDAGVPVEQAVNWS